MRVPTLYILDTDNGKEKVYYSYNKALIAYKKYCGGCELSKIEGVEEIILFEKWPIFDRHTGTILLKSDKVPA